MKTAEQALVESILDGIGDDEMTVAEKAAHAAEQVDAYRKHIAKATSPFLEALKQRESEMTRHDEVIRAISKRVVEDGAPPVFNKSEYLRAIARRAAEVRKAGRSDAQAFADAITGDDVARTLYTAMRFAKGQEVEADAVEDLVAPPAPKGPANQELSRLADAHLKANPDLATDAFGRPKWDGGKAAAHAYVYGHPDNRDLVARVKAEDLAGIRRTPAGHAVSVDMTNPDRLAHARAVRTA